MAKPNEFWARWQGEWSISRCITFHPVEIISNSTLFQFSRLPFSIPLNFSVECSPFNCRVHDDVISDEKKMCYLTRSKNHC